MSTALFTSIVLSVALISTSASPGKTVNRNLVLLERANRSPAPHENLADAAERVLNGVRETHYQHRTHVDTGAGAYDVDCAGFVDYLLKRVAPAQFAQLPVEAGHDRPRAWVYYAFLHNLCRTPSIGWESVQRLVDARRGDLLAWKREALIQGTGDTGHVAIVARIPVRQPDGTFNVEVYDSSTIQHDFDSRAEGTNGIGKGVVTVEVNSRGEPVAVRFNSGARFQARPMAIGRPAD